GYGFENVAVGLAARRYSAEPKHNGVSPERNRLPVARLQDLPPAPPARTAPVVFGSTSESLVLFQGAMVSMMMLIPANTLSISPCTRPTSDFRNSCIRWSSDASPSSSLTELNANRATEDLIRSEPFS